MNKTELITAMATKSGLTKKEASAALASLIDGITDALKTGERVAVPSLGRASLKCASAPPAKARILAPARR